MLIFIDTEFTSFEERYLISAGLIANGREFYFEVEGLSPAICSPFVQGNVIPLLSGATLKPVEIARQLKEFLAPCGPEVTFFCDAPRYDIALLEPFLPASLQWKPAVPSFADPLSQHDFEVALEIAYARGLRRHHALDDAKALAAAWASIGQQPGDTSK